MNIFGYILIVLTLLLTIVIGVKQPPMHSRIIVYDSQYEIVEEKKSPPVEVVTKSEELPTMPVENTLTKVQIVMEEQEQPKTVQNVKTTEQPKTVSKTKQNKTDSKQQTNTNNKKETVQKTTVQKPVTTTTQQPTTKQTQTVTKPEQKIQTVNKTTPTQTVTVMTAQQEEIAWNKWRSNLQNQIMRDTRLPNIPIGTIFKMSFDVDKNGRVTNVQTWSLDPKYTPYAIEYIAPVIRSYQGKSILEFPQGSQRTATTFTGGWKIAQTSKYSTPENYNDIEKVTK